MGKRDKISKNIREKGLPSTSRYLRSYEVGEKVAIKIDPSIHKGAPHHKFHGHTGEIIKEQGDSYLIRVQDRGKTKKIIVSTEHLQPLQERD